MKYFVIAFSLLKQFESYNIQHVPRIENQEANDLAQIAYGYKVSKETFEQLIEVKDKLVSNESLNYELSMPKHLGADEPNFQENFEKFEFFENFNLQNVNSHLESFVTEIFVIDNLSDDDWRKPIVRYLEDPTGITDRKIKYKALSYTIIGNELFKKTPEGFLLKCLSENEAFLAISSIHSGSCGAHQADHKMKWLLFRRGLYWPSMLKDCIEFAKGCQECQRHAGI
ncbi:hypothetical protein QL285_053221 [Trifolium repens]|nr:hypothetical protein QL285_053221 [Trifolium repens]